MIRVLGAVAENVVAPLAVYGLAVLAGVAPVWALVIASGVSALVVAVGWVRTREVSTLGSLVGVRLVLGVAVAGLTGDARLVLVKDAAVTGVIALVAVGSLLASRPLIARIRRDLDPAPDAFTRRWDGDPSYRRAHRVMTGVWVAGLLAEVTVVSVAALTAPLPVAVVVAQAVPVPVLLGLIGWTQVWGRSLDRRAHEHTTGARAY